MIRSVRPYHQPLCRSIFGAALSVLMISTPLHAQNSEVIHLDNGDRVTGKIVELVAGEVEVKTSSMGSVYINWIDVDRLESTRRLNFETESGERFYGTVKPTSEPGSLQVVSTKDTVELELDDIVHIQLVKTDTSLWDALDKNLQLGFNYSDASEVVNWNIAAGLEYKGLRSVSSISFHSIVTNQEQGEDSQLAALTGSYTRLLADRWSWFTTGSVQKNDALGIDRRFLITGGFGRYVVQNNHTELSLRAGLAGNWERSVERPVFGQEYDQSVEGLLEAKWSFFKLRIPRSRISLEVQYYPGISNADRNRANGVLTLRQEFVEDLFWDLRIYGSYDSEPPEVALSKTNYGVVTSLDYEF